MSQNSGFRLFVKKNFLWIHISLALYAHWGYFQRCVQYGPQRPNFGAILNPKVNQNSGLGSLSQKFSLVSHQYCFTCSLHVSSVLLHMLISSTFRCVENMGFRTPNLGSFWTPRVKISVFGNLKKQIPLVSHQSWFPCQFELLLEVCWI